MYFIGHKRIASYKPLRYYLIRINLSTKIEFIFNIAVNLILNVIFPLKMYFYGRKTCIIDTLVKSFLINTNKVIIKFPLDMNKCRCFPQAAAVPVGILCFRYKHVELKADIFGFQP